MKKLYIFSLIATLSDNMFAQLPAGLASYPVSIPSTTVTTQNILNRSAFVIDNTGNKWIGFNSGNANSFQLIKFNGTQWDTFPAFHAILPNNKVNALAVDASNNVWIGSNAGLTKYNGTTFTTYNTSNSGIVSDTIISLACGNNNVYAGTNNKGLSVYNGSSFINYNTSNGMNSNMLNCITVENTNAIWLGNPNGLDKFNGSSFTFNYVTSNSTAEVVNCIYVDAQNNKWLGTNTLGAIKYDNSNFYTMQQLYPGNTTQEILGIGNWPTVVKTMCKGPNGGVLFCAPSIYGSLGASIIYAFSCEVTNTQLYSYRDMVSTTSATTPYGFLQHDVGSNKIFYTGIVGGLNPFLYSFDSSLYTPYLFDETNTNTAFLDINNTTALITDNSLLHFDDISGKSKYFSDKQNDQSPLHASAMWIGGYVNGGVRIAAMTYRQSGYDFWPGPLNAADSGRTDFATSLAYNQVWKVNRFDIANFIYNWNAGNVQNGNYPVPASIVNWPGNSIYPSQTMAPFVDYNNDGVYNCMQGDYPLIKGDQMIWSVYNDNTNRHTETGSQANLGIEVHASAYAFTCPSIADSNVVLNNTTFYNYQIFNRSQNQVDQTHIGLWMDTDLGNYADDYIGCDVTNDFGYTYNGDGYDEDTYLGTGYHHNLPVFACNVLRGPVADAGDGIDNNHNCMVDEAGERCMMSGFTYYTNTSATLNGNPGSFNGTGYMGYYNLLRSHWEPGQPMTYGNLGLNTPSVSTPTCTYLFPGNTDPYGYGLGGSCSNPVASPTSIPWTEGSVGGNNPGDRRFLVNVGPFTMQTGGMYELDYALVFTQDSATCDTNNTCLIARATQDNQRVKHWFNTNTYPSCLSLVGVGIKQNTTPQLNLNLYPNPANNNNVYVEFGTAQKNVTIEVIDMLGSVVRGYQYAELDKYATIPVSDLQSGVYMVKVISTEGFAIKRFVKE